MFRDRLKNAVRKAALRALKMEKEAADRTPREKIIPGATVDLSKIPKLVDGDGDTPGPNHKTRIGRTWLSAQVTSGVSPVLIDIREPTEWTGGILPGAHLLPAQQLRDRLDLLPPKAMRVTVYDSDGGAESDTLADWLREQGWSMARQLQGGWAEWLEHGEPISQLNPIEGARAQVGTPVSLVSGDRGVVQGVDVSEEKTTYLVLQEDGSVTTSSEEDLAE